MTLMAKYNHMVDIAFEVHSSDPEGKDITPAMYRAALLRRIITLDETDLWEEATGIADTFEIEEPVDA